MNDLERDLKELLETKAGGLDTTPLAPPAVLRRGRRRQVGTVVGGALMAIAAAAVVVGGTAAFLGDRASEPPIMGEREVLPAELRLDTRKEGDELVASGDGWEIGVGPDPDWSQGGIARIVIGGEESYTSLMRGGGMTAPMAGGALSVTVLAPDEGPVSVTVDDTGQTLYGRWMPGSDQFGKDSRWWVLPLPGIGSGLVRHGPDDLPVATSWPPGREPAAGVVSAAGTFSGISWKFAYASAGCLVLAQVAGDPSIGQTECLEAPARGDGLVSFAAGDERSLIAFVGPENLMRLDGPGPDGETIYGQCSGSGAFDDGAWAQHGICAIAIPNDEDVTLQPMGWDPDTKEDIRLDPFTVRVSDGELFLTEGA